MLEDLPFELHYQVQFAMNLALLKRVPLFSGLAGMEDRDEFLEGVLRGCHRPAALVTITLGIGGCRL